MNKGHPIQRRAEFFLVAALLLSAVLPAAVSDAAVNVTFFRTALRPYGIWLNTGCYGPCWYPRTVDADWRHDADGHWVYTDRGWCWVADEPCDWPACHCGRWGEIDDASWCWVPGLAWSPAWLAFRSSRDDIGWAPLPPLARLHPGASSRLADVHFDSRSAHSYSLPLKRFSIPHRCDSIFREVKNTNVSAQWARIAGVQWQDRRNLVQRPVYDPLVRQPDVRIPKLRLDQEAVPRAERASRPHYRIDSGRQVMPTPAVRAEPQAGSNNLAAGDVRRDHAEVPGLMREHGGKRPNEVSPKLTPSQGSPLDNRINNRLEVRPGRTQGSPLDNRINNRLEVRPGRSQGSPLDNRINNRLEVHPGRSQGSPLDNRINNRLEVHPGRSQGGPLDNRINNRLEVHPGRSQGGPWDNRINNRLEVHPGRSVRSFRSGHPSPNREAFGDRLGQRGPKPGRRDR